MADVTVTAANVKKDTATVKTGVAGASITAGQTLYVDSNGTLSPAKADAAGTATCVGVALNSVSTGQSLCYVDSGVIFAGGTLVAGKMYVVSAAAAGGLAPSADLTSTNLASYVGYATSTSKLQVNIINTGLALA